MDSKPKVTDFIGVRAKYDRHGQSIIGIDATDGIHWLADVRGWGAIQNLFKNKDQSIDMEKAEAFQDELGQWLADAVNEKLARECGY